MVWSKIGLRAIMDTNVCRKSCQQQVTPATFWLGERAGSQGADHGCCPTSYKPSACDRMGYSELMRCAKLGSMAGAEMI